MKTIAIHQPNYLPWLGYFYKIAHCDVFVFLDDVEFSKRSFTRRVHIRKHKGSQEKTFLIVPLKQHSDYALINELKIDHRQNWQQKQINQLSNTYNNAPAYGVVIDLINQWMERSIQFSYLSEWNQFLIKEISSLIDIKPHFICSSELPVDGKASSLNIDIVRHLEGQVYLSGAGGKKYQSGEQFSQANIKLLYSSFQEKAYTQNQGEWLGGLSIIDLIFNDRTPFINISKK